MPEAVALELVVARYREDISWVANLKKTIPSLATTIYDKSPPPEQTPEATSLPNTGNEAHSYLYHLVERYRDLAEITVFCQGHPFDHVPDLKRMMVAIARGEHMLDGSGFEWLGFMIDTDDARGRRLHIPWTKNPRGEELPSDELFRELFQQASPPFFVFRPGGQFAVSRDCLRRRPLSFYRHALNLAARDQAWTACCFERMWDYVFDVNGPESDLLQGAKTRYLRKTKQTHHPLTGESVLVAPLHL